MLTNGSQKMMQNGENIAKLNGSKPNIHPLRVKMGTKLLRRGIRNYKCVGFFIDKD